MRRSNEGIKRTKGSDGPSKYRLITPEGIFTAKGFKSEAELERLVVKNSRNLFGEKSIYFDIKLKIKSIAKERITGGLLLDLNPAKPSFRLVGNELSTHIFQQFRRDRPIKFSFEPSCLVILPSKFSSYIV